MSPADPFVAPPPYRIARNIVVHTFRGTANSHLLLCNGHAVLVDCADYGLSERIKDCGLPSPEAIVHTRVSAHTCLEGSAFGAADTLVHANERILIEEASEVRHRTHRQTAELAEWADKLGAEPFGIAGWQMRFPIDTPPQRLRNFTHGSTFRVGPEHHLEAVPLPVFGPAATGFRLMDDQGRSVAFFCGELLNHGPHLNNLYELEKNYGNSHLADYPGLLAQTTRFGPIPWFPLHGPVIPDGAACTRVLADKINAHLEALRWNPLPNPAARQERRRFGRYHIHRPGVYQLANGGNTILLVQPDGHGLLVDPGPCDFENPRREEEFVQDLVRFETEAGLQTIDLVLLTHFHGDHIDCADLIRRRYPGCRVAAWSPVADVVEHPERYPYCARLPWYGIGKAAVSVDLRLTRCEPLDWRGTPIHTLHLPGHAFIHAGYRVRFNGETILCAGDSVQSNGEALGLHALPGNHSVPDESEGCLACFLTLCGQHIDLNLGGHGTWFENTSTVYAASRDRMRHALPSLRALLSDGDLHRAFVPAHFPRWTSSQLA